MKAEISRQHLLCTRYWGQKSNDTFPALKLIILAGEGDSLPTQCHKHYDRYEDKMLGEAPITASNGKVKETVRDSFQEIMILELNPE